MINSLGILLLAAVATQPVESVSLTKLMPDKIESGMAALGIDRSFGSIWWPPDAKPLRIADRTFQQGLGTCARNTITYRLQGRYKRFRTWIGVDAEVTDKPDAGVTFRIRGDGNVLFASSVMRASDQARLIDVSVEGVNELVLEADHAGSGGAADHADWADPVLLGVVPHARFSDSDAAYAVNGTALRLQLDAKGFPCALELPASGLKYAIDGASELEGCALTGTQLTKTATGIQVARTLSCGARLVEIFQPAGPGVRWQVEIATEGKPWGGHFNTVLRWLDPQAVQLWTAWGGGMDWHNPLGAWAFKTDWYEYGTFFNRSYGVSLPMFAMMDPAHDTAVTLTEDFNDKIIKMNLASDEDGTLTFSRYNLRMGEGKHWHFAVELLPHAADVRAALGTVVDRFPSYFDPPNPHVQELSGHAAYSASEEDPSPKFHDLDFVFNWKASFDFPYMGMFLPPIPPREQWLSFGGDTDGKVDGNGNRLPRSVSELAAYSTRMRRLGFHVLNYFNVTEFGTGIEYPAPKLKAADPREFWKDPNDFLYHAIPGAAILDPEPRFTWGRAVVVDCGDPDYRQFLLEQARRHVKELPDSAGICIDRLDWLYKDNPHADDGLTWNNGPARSLLNSWQDLMVEMGPIFHAADKVIFGNPMIRRPDLARYLDGFYDEHGDFGYSINTTSFLALRKPASMWTRDEDQLKADPDGIMQRSLYMGVFLTAPLPGNDHCLLPSVWAEKLYADYGPLFAALRGRKWVLAPHVIASEGSSLSNVFEVPTGYVAVIAQAGARPSVRLKLNGLELRGLNAEFIVPGEKSWTPLAIRISGKTAEMQVPVRRGSAVVRLVRL